MEMPTDRSLPVFRDKFRLRLLSPRNWHRIGDDFESFEEHEHVTAAKIVTLENIKTKETTEYVGIGTGILYIITVKCVHYSKVVQKNVYIVYMPITVKCTYYSKLTTKKVYFFIFVCDINVGRHKCSWLIYHIGALAGEDTTCRSNFYLFEVEQSFESVISDTGICRHLRHKNTFFGLISGLKWFAHGKKSEKNTFL